MTEDAKDKLTPAQRTAIAALRRPCVPFEQSPEEQKQAEEVRAGDPMSDGSIYLGSYSGKDWFVTAEDAKDKNGHDLKMDFNDAAKYAKNLKAHGHDDWKLPPGGAVPGEPDILNQMFNHKSTGAFRGTYDESGSASGWYWCTKKLQTKFGGGVWGRLFSIGTGAWRTKSAHISVRCVRSEPRP